MKGSKIKIMKDKVRNAIIIFTSYNWYHINIFIMRLICSSKHSLSKINCNISLYQLYFLLVILFHRLKDVNTVLWQLFCALTADTCCFVSHQHHGPRNNNDLLLIQYFSLTMLYTHTSSNFGKRQLGIRQTIWHGVKMLSKGG